MLIAGWHHPVNTAKALATLDVLNGGRTIVGVGTGWMREQFEILGSPFEARGARIDLRSGGAFGLHVDVGAVDVHARQDAVVEHELLEGEQRDNDADDDPRDLHRPPEPAGATRARRGRRRVDDLHRRSLVLHGT